MICSRCGKDKQDKFDFFTLKTKEKLDICWDCLLENVDLDDESTFIWIFELVDCPYCLNTFNHYVLSSEYNVKKALKKYLAWTKLKTIKDFTYGDSFRFKELGW